ncbi:type II secretion system protein [Photobacterium leiognathi]|nr:type II secretion system protein [Photobacterium leiognathi]
MKHRKQVGFTLIELVIVITILGIVTVTAAPKFLNISSDARVAVLNGIAGSIKTINTIVNTKAIIQAVPDTGDDKNRTIATNLGPVDT